MSKGKLNRDSFYYRTTYGGFHYNTKDFWKPGDPVTEEDQALLKSVKEFYQQNGYSPSKADLPEDASRLKQRFRTWKNVLIAADLPHNNDAENQMIRQNKTE